MPAVYPFNAVQYKKGSGDVSSMVAPPYDVLDASSKKALIMKDQHNIAAIDLPHTPAKELGPPEAYQNAAAMYQAWFRDGTLSRRAEPAMFAYRQAFKTGDETIYRSGMACTVEAVPFGPRPGGGILPHEETFSGPKEDRLALMRATGAQLSPIFGLFADERGAATRLLRDIMKGSPDLTAETPDSVRHEVWTITDPVVMKAYQDALADEAIFIADGHHRYNTALNYLKELEARGPVPAGHPARRCMMVLVGMSDPGLVIWPTHRVLGGMSGYSFQALVHNARGMLNITPVGSRPPSGGGAPRPGALAELEAAVGEAGRKHTSVLGLYDFGEGGSYVATPEGDGDPLKDRFGGKPEAWRRLDVALVQHLLVEQVCQPRLNAGEPVKWAFPHTIAEVESIATGAETGAGGGKGFKPQLAVILRPTPLGAVREISAAGELMPQKSTFFYPKLATGLWINPLGQPGNPPEK